jgi:hypothetical protein
MITGEGLLVTGEDGQPRRHPLWGTRRSLAIEVRTALRAFRLEPSARPVPAPGEPLADPKDPARLLT